MWELLTNNYPLFLLLFAVVLFLVWGARGGKAFSIEFNKEKGSVSVGERQELTILKSENAELTRKVSGLSATVDILTEAVGKQQLQISELAKKLNRLDSLYLTEKERADKAEQANLALLSDNSRLRELITGRIMRPETNADEV